MLRCFWVARPRAIRPAGEWRPAAAPRPRPVRRAATGTAGTAAAVRPRTAPLWTLVCIAAGVPALVPPAEFVPAAAPIAAPAAAPAPPFVPPFAFGAPVSFALPFAAPLVDRSGGSIADAGSFPPITPAPIPLPFVPPAGSGPGAGGPGDGGAGGPGQPGGGGLGPPSGPPGGGGDLGPPGGGGDLGPPGGGGPAPVPEPTALAVFGLGLAGLAFAARRPRPADRVR